MNPKDYKAMQAEITGKFGGLGIEVTMENGVIKVVSPIDDTPASRAGMLAIDIRERIDSVTSATTLIDGAKAVRAHFAVDGAVPVIDAASEPLRAIAAVGAMIPTDSAMASMTPSCGRSLLISPLLSTCSGCSETGRGRL